MNYFNLRKKVFEPKRRTDLFTKNWTALLYVCKTESNTWTIEINIDIKTVVVYVLTPSWYFPHQQIVLVTVVVLAMDHHRILFVVYYQFVLILCLFFAKQSTWIVVDQMNHELDRKEEKFIHKNQKDTLKYCRTTIIWYFEA